MTQAAATVEETAPVYLQRSSDRYRYLRLLFEGVPYEQAREAVGVTERQARRWRDELRRAVGLVLDRDVNLVGALRYAFERSVIGGQIAPPTGPGEE